MMSNALWPLWCKLTSVVLTATTQPATQPTKQLDPPTVLLAIGICVMAIWIVRRLAEPKKLSLASAPGRPAALNPIHVLVVLIVWIAVQGGLAELLKIYLAEDSFAFKLLPNAFGGIVLALSCLVTANLTFTHGLSRGFGLSMRHWLYDSGRGLVGMLAVFPICYALWRAAVHVLPPEMQPVHELLMMVTNGNLGLRIAVIVTAVVIAPIAEEMFFRGLLQTLLRKYLANPWAAIGLSSVAFAAMHYPFVQNMPALLALSVVLGYNYERCGRLYAPILIHALFNAANIWIVLSAAS